MALSTQSSIVVYASDHGFGHATRVAALAEYLNHRGHSVTLIAGAAAPTLQSYFGIPKQRDDSTAVVPGQRQGVQVVQASLDIGLVQSTTSISHDLDASRAKVRHWFEHRYASIVAEETERLRRIAPKLVIVDVVAPAIEAAAAASTCAIIVSNFTWLDQYGSMFGQDLEAALMQAYQKAELGIRLSPGKLSLRGAKRIVDVSGVLARLSRRPRGAVREELGASPTDFLVMLGLGRGFDSTRLQHFAQAASSASGIRLVLPDDSAVAFALTFPATTSDSHEYLAACDVVITKGGYSTVAEAALAGTPCVVFPLATNAESAKIASEAEQYGYGIQSSQSEIEQWLAEPTLLRRALAAFSFQRATNAAPGIEAILHHEGLLG